MCQPQSWLIFDVRRNFVSARILVPLAVFTLSGCSQRATQTHEFAVRQLYPTALEDFRRDVGRYPTQEEGLAALVSPPPAMRSVWHGPYPKSATVIPPDPWLRPYVYRSPSRVKGKSYDLLCLGADGVETPDDVIVSR